MVSTKEESIITQSTATCEDENSHGDESPLKLEPLKHANSDPTIEEENISLSKNLTEKDPQSLADSFPKTDQTFADAISHDLREVKDSEKPVSFTAGEDTLKKDGDQPAQNLDFESLGKIESVSREVAREREMERDREALFQSCELFWKSIESLPVEQYHNSLNRIVAFLEKEEGQCDEPNLKRRK